MPRRVPKTSRRAEVDFEASATGRKVRNSDIATFFATFRYRAKQPFMVGTFKISLGTSANRTLDETALAVLALVAGDVR